MWFVAIHVKPIYNNHGTSHDQILNVILALILYSLVHTALHLIVVNLSLCLEVFHCVMSENMHIVIVPSLLLNRYVTLPSTGQEGCTMQRNVRLVIYCDTLLQVLSLLCTPEYNSAHIQSNKIIHVACCHANRGWWQFISSVSIRA